MTLARVHTIQLLNPQTFDKHMRVAWSPTKEVKLKPLEDNLLRCSVSALEIG
jgi:hypothetical protein